MNKRGKLTIIVGANYGSEGKGGFCAHIAHDYDMAIRVGAIQAGHTIYYNEETFKMQSIPCAWINPKCKLVIGAGGMIRQDIFEREVRWIANAMYGGDDNGIINRMAIDNACGIMSHEHADREQARKIDTTIGSTCEGVGEATADRVRRMLPIASEDDGVIGGLTADTVKIINDALKNGEHVMLEGTQGAALCLYTGRDKNGKPFYPNCTSREVTPAGMMADCGISPGITKYADIEIIAVMRTYPIRIAGPSGDMGVELTWEEITRRSGSLVPLTEKTTVTKKTRRVGELDKEWTKYVLDYIQPDKIVLTFADYINAEDFGKRELSEISDKTKEYVADLEKEIGFPIEWISTGPLNDDFVCMKEIPDVELSALIEMETTLSGLTRPKKHVNPEFAPVYVSKTSQPS